MKKENLQISFDLETLNKINITEKKLDKQSHFNDKKLHEFNNANYSDETKDINSRNLYNKDINNINSRILTAEEEKEYFRKIHNGDLNAKEEFINFNLKLVISVANKYTSYASAFSDLDIIQEGNIGLMKAISKYDPSKGNKFSTYAVWWINQSIKRALEDKTNIIKVPNHRVQQLNRINKFINKYKALYNNDPTAEEIALAIGDTEESVKKALLYNNGVISLNNNYTDDRDTELGEIVSDGFNLESEVLKKEQLHCLKECLKKLSDEEKEIITLRFFNNYKISQIERLLGIPRTRINKILDTSLNKMKLLLVGKVS